MRSAICLIAHYPREVWLDFLITFTFYDIYMIVDDNSADYQELYGKKYPNIWFIQIANDKYKNAHFIDQDFPNEIVMGWHKSLYYFSTVNINYDQVWFFEDDVFFYSESTLRQIDVQYPISHLLSNNLTVNLTGEKNEWHWYKINIHPPPPYYNGMMCCVRMSRELLDHIREYATEHKSLFFIEAMFPTLAKHYGLTCDSPDELTTVYYRHDFRKKDIDKSHVYHPMKNYELHGLLREQLI
jgi:hypothetical protein